MLGGHAIGQPNNMIECYKYECKICVFVDMLRAMQLYFSMNIMTYFSCSGGLILGLPVDIEKIMLTFIV